MAGDPAKRTLNDIQGTYGLSNDATKDPFAQSEQAILANVGTYLKESQSARKESIASAGFNIGSSFHNAVGVKEDAGIMQSVYSDFAKSRTTEDLNKSEFARQKEMAVMNTDLDTYKLKEQAQLASDASKQEAAQTYGYKTEQYIDANGQQQTRTTNEIATAYQRQSDMYAQQIQGGLITAQDAYDKQMGYVDKNGVMQEGTIAKQYRLQSDAITKDAQEGRISQIQAYNLQVGYDTVDENGQTVHVDGTIDSNYKAQTRLENDQAYRYMIQNFGQDSVYQDPNTGELRIGLKGGAKAQEYYYANQLNINKIKAQAKADAAKANSGFLGQLVSGAARIGLAIATGGGSEAVIAGTEIAGEVSQMA